jgi:hypothetical protein
MTTKERLMELVRQQIQERQFKIRQLQSAEDKIISVIQNLDQQVITNIERELLSKIVDDFDPSEASRQELVKWATIEKMADELSDSEEEFINLKFSIKNKLDQLRASQSNQEVDPLARTQDANVLRKENKIITKSLLRQIIKEEIEVILSDEEAKEMFDIDVQEELEDQEK